MITEEEISTEFSPQDNNNNITINNNNDEKDQRRLSLLNDANYGIILCFLEKFRTILDLPNYSFQRLEDHLINYQERIPPRLIDFHFILLKRLSLAKNTQRDKFDSIITRFASRFDLNDADHLTTTGYLQAEINVKIRILKNLLESHFDLNQTFTKTLADKSAREIKSIALGRDRFGVSYWLFVDTNCFVRLFREDIDIDRTWSNVAKDRDELENFIKLLITDSVVRKKFSDWAIDYEPFSSLLPTNDFEERYLPLVVDTKHEENDIESTPTENESVKKRRGRPKSSIKLMNNEKNHIEMEIKQEEDEEEEDTEPNSNDNEKSTESLKKKRGRPRGSIASSKKIDVKVKQEEEEEDTNPISNDDESMKKKRGRPKTSIKSLAKEQIQMNTAIKKEKQEVELTSGQNEISNGLTKKRPGRPPRSSIKQIDMKIKEEKVEPISTEDTKSEISTKKRRGRPRSLTKPIEMKEEEIEHTSNEDEELDISTKKRRGRPRSSTKSLTKETKQSDVYQKEEVITPARRGRKRKIITEDIHNDDDDDNDDSKMEENDKQQDDSSVSHTDQSIRRSARPRKSTTMELTPKAQSQISHAKKKRSMNGKTKTSNNSLNPTKSSRSRRRRKTTSRRNIDDDLCLSSSSSDEHIDYLSDYDSDDYLPNLTELEHDENFFLLDEDNNPTGEELRTAKTAQASTIITACNVCSKSDRPEVLLLCDDCDDAYHLECLRPILLSVPDGDWFCPLCEHRKLSNYLIEKLKDLLINFNLIETKRLERDSKKSLQRKLKIKEYTSDESITASESEHENLENTLHGDESMLSISQTNENSNISSSYFDDSNKNISQRGRRRRTRFDMNKMLNDEDDEDNDKDDDHDHHNDNESDKSHSDTDEDDEYIENTTHTTNFDLQLPKKMTRLLNNRYRPIARNDQRFRPKPIAPRLCHTSVDLNEKLGSPIIYVNGDGNSHQIKSVITNSNQTLKIVRRWNDVQRRNRLRTNNLKLLNETTSDCADENSVFCPDDSSPPRSNDSNSNHDIKEEEEEDSTIIRSKITLAQPANLLPIYKSSTKNIVRKNEVTFDRLTRDIQYAVSEANTLSTTPKTIDQQNMKRTQKTNFSPYLTKIALRPLPVLLPKPAGVGYKIFKSKDPPISTSMTTTTTTTTSSDLSNIILTPSSSSSLLDGNDEQSTAPMNT
ncbi:unnamed protein product [Adineta steineri]|uniref:PHD-type domain-containing protein n=1 Tax=Adineta steineri TaxID=433720 RepID=A0A819E0R1_9BILA|nr:unnamed protein product [Adineta steineri]